MEIREIMIDQWGTFPASINDRMLLESKVLGITEWAATGSRAICPFHAKPESDYDFICLAKTLPEAQSFACHQSMQLQPMFSSLKFKTPLGTVNLIVTAEPGFYRLFNLATEVARKLALVHRPDRVTLFQAILYGNKPMGE